MTEQNYTEMTWWERNKKKVLIIGGVVVAVGIGVVVFKNKDALIGLVKKGKITVPKVAIPDVKQVIDIVPEATTVVKTENVLTTTPLNNGQHLRSRGLFVNSPRITICLLRNGLRRRHLESY